MQLSQKSKLVSICSCKVKKGISIVMEFRKKRITMLSFPLTSLKTLKCIKVVYLSYFISNKCQYHSASMRYQWSAIALFKFIIGNDNYFQDINLRNHMLGASTHAVAIKYLCACVCLPCQWFVHVFDQNTYCIMKNSGSRLKCVTTEP